MFTLKVSSHREFHELRRSESCFKSAAKVCGSNPLATGGVSSALVQSPFKEKDARFIVERNLSFRKKGFDDLGSLRPSKMKATRIAECSSKHRLTF